MKKHVSQPTEAHGRHTICTLRGSSPWFQGEFWWRVQAEQRGDPVQSWPSSTAPRELWKQALTCRGVASPQLSLGQEFLPIIFIIISWQQHLPRKWCCDICAICQSGEDLNRLWLQIWWFWELSVNLMSYKTSLVLNSTVYILPPFFNHSR